MLYTRRGGKREVERVAFSSTGPPAAPQARRRSTARHAALLASRSAVDGRLCEEEAFLCRKEGSKMASLSGSFLASRCAMAAAAPRRQLVIQNAHKKGAGSTKNGRDSNAQRRGTKVFGGQPVKAGGIIVRQVGQSVSGSTEETFTGVCARARLALLRSISASKAFPALRVANWSACSVASARIALRPAPN